MHQIRSFKKLDAKNNLSAKAHISIDGIWKGRLALPPIDSCIIFDIETDLNIEKVWMIGVSKGGVIQQFVAKNWKEERKILLEFNEYLTNNPQSPLICFSRTNFDFRVVWNAVKRLKLIKFQNLLSST